MRASSVRGRRTVLAGVVVGALVGAAGASAVVSARLSTVALDGLDAPAAAVGQPVRSGSADSGQSVTLTASMAAPATVGASGLSGTITSVAVHEGDTLVAGSVLYDVDAVTVRAWTDLTVLYRPVSLGDSGDDVTAVQRYLSAVLPGVDVGAAGKVSTTTVKAIQRYARLVGISTPDGSFLPEWTVRVPEQFGPIDHVLVAPGDPAPSPGTAVIAGLPALQKVSVLDERGTPVGLPDGPYVVAVQGSSVQLVLAGGTWALGADDVSQAVLRHAAGSDGSASVTGYLTAQQPMPAQVVAGGAVFSDDGAGTCVAVLDPAGAAHAVRVTVIGSDPDGSALLEPVLDADALVVVNVAAALRDLPCPSS